MSNNVQIMDLRFSVSSDDFSLSFYTSLYDVIIFSIRYFTVLLSSYTILFGSFLYDLNEIFSQTIINISYPIIIILAN